ncbi:MAG: hypothetical protein Q9222_006076 [Ikaeria aurantiellina]
MTRSVALFPSHVSIFDCSPYFLTPDISSPPFLSGDQIAQAGLTDDIAANMKAAWDFEQSKWATGSVDLDPFYKVPEGSLSAGPGTLLEVEQATDTTKFTLPSTTALSRLLYQTRTLNGKAIPASAFILWPHSPRRQPDGSVPIVAWAHGTSGLFGDQAPSHLKGLSYQFGGPYILVLQGYAVVAPDYAGLGVDRTAHGETIQHEYLASPAHANDLFYAVQAAQATFPGLLSKQFVIIGHSQGGGAAWAAAQRQAVEPVEGYLGAVAASPVTDLLRYPPEGPLFPMMMTFVFHAVRSLNSDFDYRDVLTEAAAKRWDLYLQLKAGVGVGFALLLAGGIDLLKPHWAENSYLRNFVTRTSNGGKAISGPLLVLQGLADVNIDAETTAQAVRSTRRAFPESQLEYQTWEGVTHSGTMFVAQRVWLQWIEDRFAERPVVVNTNEGQEAEIRHTALLPQAQYQQDTNWIVQEASQMYELAMP